MLLLETALQRRTLTIVVAGALALVGIQSFSKLGRLEDPDFTIKTALIITNYPGASAVEVEQELTDRLETAVQELGELDDVRSISRPGQSILVVDLKDTTPQATIPQVWDELRRKISDAVPGLPPGVSAPSVIDDYGDVFGALFAVHGDGFSLPELKRIADDLQTELLAVEGVASVQTWGAPVETVEVVMTRSQLAELGLTPLDIFQTLEQRSRVVPSGRVQGGARDLRVVVDGAPKDLSDIEDLIVRGRDSETLARLGDVATVGLSLLDPPSQLMFFDGRPSIALGVSTVSGGNVVDTGHRIAQAIDGLESRLPLGVELARVSFQAQTVDSAVDAFLLNLFAAVAIVVGLLLIFMGLRSGLIIGAVLLLTILGTFMFMAVFDISLQRISLGALVIALGMLVDNAIVVIEGIIVRIEQGEAVESAARVSVKETMWPLLGATVVAILAFAAISLSPDSAGEFLASLFQVIAISLLLSWVLAVTITPLLGVLFLRRSGAAAETADPYGGRFFGAYRALLRRMIRFRWLTIATVGALLFGALSAFGLVKQNFFPDSSRPQFLVEYWRPEGSRIEKTGDDLRKLSNYIRTLDGVTHTTTFAGSGALRFILTYEAELPNSSYGQIVVAVDDHQKIDGLREKIERWWKVHLPHAEPRTKRFVIGAGGGAKIEARYSGPDPAVLRSLAEQAEAIMRAEPTAKDVRNDWRGAVPVLVTPWRQASARRAGVSRIDLAQSLALSTTGVTVGTHRRGEDLLPIRLRLPESERQGVGAVEDASVWSHVSRRALPARQVLGEPVVRFEDGVIRRRNRIRTLTVQAEPSDGIASVAFTALKPKIEAIDRPHGYRLEWGGEHEASNEANGMLLANVPMFMGMMFIIVVGLFNAIRTPVIVFATLPLSIIGVTAGLLAFDKPFGFVALLGFLSLSGMLIKNAIVLIEQININLGAGQAPFDAVIDAGVTRVRPVAMAAFTTVLGMIPLVSDVFFGALAVTIMGGLTFATVLTLLVVPVLYATFYRIRTPA